MFQENKTFYPTPEWLIKKMLKGVDLNFTTSILEPSAGQGHILDVIKDSIKLTSRVSYDGYSIDCIEKDTKLQYILKGKGYRIIHDDFLSFDTFKKYDLIIMNPPFNGDEGCKHLLKALKIQKYGGKIVCILNAETIRNPYTNARKDLLNQLEECDAEIEFVEGAFSDAERKTDVDIALISIDVKANRRNSVIIDHLKQEEEYKKTNTQANDVVSGDYIERVIQQYDFEIKAGVKLINEYLTIQPMLSRSFDDNWSILELSIYDSRYNKNSSCLINDFIKKVRYKYWSTLFRSDEFSQLMTRDLYSQYMEKIDELQDYDFSRYNIEQIKKDMLIGMKDSLEQTILDLFNDFISYSYSDEYKNNIYLYNGWKTNKAYKISEKKIILPINAYGFWNNKFTPTDYQFEGKIRDIEKVFNYLDSGRTQVEDDLDSILKKAEETGQTKDIDCKFFKLRCYKKGTTHVIWKDKDLIRKFNIFGSRKRGWLPPTYGKAKYEDMSKEQKDVIDSFQGKEEYNKVINNKDLYLYDSSQTLMLEG